MTIQEYVERGRKAVEAIKDYDQAQTDKLVYEAAKIIYQHAAELAREAVDETGLGYYEDKICKNTDTPAAFSSLPVTRAGRRLATPRRSHTSASALTTAP